MDVDTPCPGRSDVARIAYEPVLAQVMDPVAVPSWSVEEAGESGAVLAFRHHHGEWPWAYEARQEFALDERGLALGLTCRNTGAEPMPCGLGQHPYFPCGPETELDTRVTHAWTVDEEVLPVERVVADGRYDLRERRVCGQDLDNRFDRHYAKDERKLRSA